MQWQEELALDVIDSIRMISWGNLERVSWLQTMPITMANGLWTGSGPSNTTSISSAIPLNTRISTVIPMANPLCLWKVLFLLQRNLLRPVRELGSVIMTRVMFILMQLTSNSQDPLQQEVLLLLHFHSTKLFGALSQSALFEPLNALNAKFSLQFTHH